MLGWTGGNYQWLVDNIRANIVLSEPDSIAFNKNTISTPKERFHLIARG